MPESGGAAKVFQETESPPPPPPPPKKSQGAQPQLSNLRGEVWMEDYSRVRGK